MVQTPQEIGRNGFDEWCWKRGLDLRGVVDGLQAAAERVAVERGRILRAPSIETVRLIRLPFTDPRRRVPAADVMELIAIFTAGEVPASDFYPEHLRGRPEPPAVVADLAEVSP